MLFFTKETTPVSFFLKYPSAIKTRLQSISFDIHVGKKSYLNKFPLEAAAVEKMDVYHADQANKTLENAILVIPIVTYTKNLHGRNSLSLKPKAWWGYMIKWEKL